MAAIVPILVNLVLAVLFAVLGALECNRLMKRHAGLHLENVLARAPHLWGIIPASLLVLAVNVAALVIRKVRPALYWGFPLWLDYSVMQIQWGLLTCVFAFTFGLASSLALRTGHRERRKVAAAAVLLVCAVQVMQWSYTRPVTGQLEDVVSAAGMVSQTSPVSCAAASGATILRTFGLTKTERDVAALYGTSILGTSAAQVVYGNERIGVVSRKRDVPDRDPAKLAAPAMIFIDHPHGGPESHAVAFLGMEKGRAVVWDPLSGLGRYEAREIASIWKGHGVEFDAPGRR